MPVHYQPVDYLIPKIEPSFTIDDAAKMQHMAAISRQQAMEDSAAQAQAQKQQQIQDYVSQPGYDPNNVDQQKGLIGIDPETGFKANQNALSAEKQTYERLDAQHKQIADFTAKIAPMIAKASPEQQPMILKNAIQSGALGKRPDYNPNTPPDMNAFWAMARIGGYVPPEEIRQNKVADAQALGDVQQGYEQTRHARDRGEKLYDQSQEIPNEVAKQKALAPGKMAEYVSQEEHKARMDALKTGKMTEDQGKASAWLIQANNAYDNMKNVMSANKDASKPGLADAIAGNGSGITGAIGNSLRSTDRQKFVQASSSLSESLLRAATGAGITKDEAQQKINELTPQWGDSEDTISQKFNAIPKYIEGLKGRAGSAGTANAERALGQQTTQQAIIPPPDLASKFTKGKIYESNGSQFLFDGEKMVKQ